MDYSGKLPLTGGGIVVGGTAVGEPVIAAVAGGLLVTGVLLMKVAYRFRKPVTAA